MNMIRHDTPRVQVVPLAMKVFQRLRDQFAVLAQEAGTAELIQLSIEADTEGAIEFRALRGVRDAAKHVHSFVMERSRYFAGEGVSQAERNEIRGVVYVPVRDVAPVMDFGLRDEVVVAQCRFGAEERADRPTKR